MKAIGKYFFLFMAIVFAVGCKNKSDLDDNGIPQKLTIGVVQAEGFKDFDKAREAICKHLSKKLGMPVEMIFSTDYNGLIEAIKAHKIDMVNLPPFAYVIATRKIKLNPIITMGNNGKPSTYQSVIIANGHSNIKSMDDVKAHSKDLTFCFVDPASASGHLIPRAYLNSIGLDPNTAFKQTIFAGNHAASVLAIKSGKIDIGCTTDLVFGIMTRAKMLNDGDLRVLWKSPPIVSDPIAVRDDINKDFAKKIQRAYLDMNTEAPELLNNYVKLFLKDTTKRSYMIVQDSMYDGLRKIAAGVKDLKSN